jgi:hypothetical protein
VSRLFIKLGEGIYQEMDKARSHKYINRKPDGKGGWIYTYYKKPFSNSYALNYEDVREFGYDKAVQIYKDTEEIRNKSIEHLICYNSEGNSILFKKGKEITVFLNKNEIEKIKNSRIMIHNHPNGSSFSPKDILSSLENNIKEIRVIGQIGNKKTNYFLKILKTITDKNIIDNIIDSYFETLKNKNIELEKLVKNGNMKGIDASNLFFHLSMIDFTNKFKDIFDYGKF